MTRNLTARVASIAFGVELAFACAIPIAYLHLFDIDEGGDRAVVIGMAAALYVVRTAGLITWLALLLRPIDRWRERSLPYGERQHRIRQIERRNIGEFRVAGN